MKIRTWTRHRARLTVPRRSGIDQRAVQDRVVGALDRRGDAPTAVAFPSLVLHALLSWSPSASVRLTRRNEPFDERRGWSLVVERRDDETSALVRVVEVRLLKDDHVRAHLPATIERAAAAVGGIDAVAEADICAAASAIGGSSALVTAFRQLVRLGTGDVTAAVDMVAIRSLDAAGLALLLDEGRIPLDADGGGAIGVVVEGTRTSPVPAIARAIEKALPAGAACTLGALTGEGEMAGVERRS